MHSSPREQNTKRSASLKKTLMQNSQAKLKHATLEVKSLVGRRAEVLETVEQFELKQYYIGKGYNKERCRIIGETKNYKINDGC